MRISDWSSDVCSSDLSIASVVRAFEDHRNALAKADAHRHECMAAAPGDKLASGSKRDPRARHAERVPDRDRAAISVHPAIVGGDAQQFHARHCLACEGLVEFDYIDLRACQPRAVEYLVRRRHPAQPPPPWLAPPNPPGP